MGLYIKKSDIVAEIEKTEKYAKHRASEAVDKYWQIHFDGWATACRSIMSFLDALEVKEVDLDKEFDNYAKNILACDVQFKPFTHLYNCAKHFYELGMQVSNKTQKGE